MTPDQTISEITPKRELGSAAAAAVVTPEKKQRIEADSSDSDTKSSVTRRVIFQDSSGLVATKNEEGSNDETALEPWEPLEPTLEKKEADNKVSGSVERSKSCFSDGMDSGGGEGDDIADVRPETASSSLEAEVAAIKAESNAISQREDRGNAARGEGYDTEEVRPEAASSSSSAEVRPEPASSLSSAEVQPEPASSSSSAEVQPEPASSSSSAAVAPVKVESNVVSQHEDVEPDAAPSSMTSAVKKEPNSEDDSETEVDDEVKLDDGWLEDFEKFLVDEQKVSRDNRRQVMKRVRDLVSGHGVSYKHWGENNAFMKKEPLHLDMDFSALLARAKAWELKWGRDKGNGWLIRHPIKKLYLFKKFRRNQKRQLANAKVKLALIKSEH